jgi:hypothetical protein
MWHEDTRAVAVFLTRSFRFMGVDAEPSILPCACLPVFGSTLGQLTGVAMYNMGKHLPPAWRPRVLQMSCSCAEILVSQPLLVRIFCVLSLLVTGRY